MLPSRTMTKSLDSDRRFVEVTLSPDDDQLVLQIVVPDRAPLSIDDVRAAALMRAKEMIERALSQAQ